MLSADWSRHSVSDQLFPALASHDLRFSSGSLFDHLFSRSLTSFAFGSAALLSASALGNRGPRFFPLVQPIITLPCVSSAALATPRHTRSAMAAASGPLTRSTHLPESAHRA